MEIIGALIAGGAIGAVLGFVGAGGAMLSVPILMYGFGFDAKSATTAALAIVFLAALSGAIPKARKGQILYRDALVIVGLGLTTNFGFATIADDLSDSFISTGFALVLVLAGLSMLRNPKFSEQTRMPVSVLIVISLVIGSITGLFGIGGGFLAIPVLVLFFGTPQAIAAGTSLLIIALNSFISFLGHHALWDSVEWHIPIFIGGAAIVVAQVASHYSAKTTPDTLRKAFAYLLLAISIFTIAQTWL
ncbi:COG0730 Predicted permeases [Candidatus Nanopelagicaceae bacterium]